MATRTLLSALSIIIAIVAISPIRVYAQDALLDEAITGQRSTRQAINSLSATVVVETEVPAHSILGVGKYWRNGETVRIQQGKEEEFTEDFQVKDGEIRQVVRMDWSQGRPTLYKASRKPSTDFLALCDAWRGVLIDLPGPNGGQMTLGRLVELSQIRSAARRDHIDGRDCIKLSLKHVNSQGQETLLSLWLDVGYGYLVRKLEATYPGTPISGNVTVSEFSEPLPGVFLPLRCRRETYTKGDLTSVTVTTLSDVKTNESIDPAVLMLPAIPSGTVLEDTIDGTTGPIDSNWKPIGPRKEWNGPSLVAPSVSGEAGLGAQSASERIPTGWLVIAVSGVVMVILLAYRLVCRLRRTEP